uniref:Chlorophyll a-b binding protein, chloroplastic n=1 Tax=Pyrobotrys stellatus TaxID=3064 RepID=Q39632_PYRST|nr:light harvesting complex I chlorophyll binding protein [Pyrobotrys stellata]
MAALVANKAALGFRAPAQARRSVVARAEQRASWFPGNPAPEYLKGELAGDYGFDPLGFGDEPRRLEWMVQAELVHCRWAMLGAAGILLPEIGNKTGMQSAAPGLAFPHWWEAGKVVAESGPWSMGSLTFTMFLLMGWAEHKRLYDFVKPGSQAVGWAWAPLGLGSITGVEEPLVAKENGYPGGIFDPFQMSKNEAKYKWYKQSEVTNGRLAMTAMFGFVSQHIAYPGKGPIDNLVDHVSNPTKVTFATNGVSVPHFIEYH